MIKQLLVSFKIKNALINTIAFVLFSTFTTTVLSAEPENTKKIKAVLSIGQPVTFFSNDKYKLAADFYPAMALKKSSNNRKSRGAGVLILHDCAHDSKNYRLLGETLAKQGVNALALDFRGYGKSSSVLFSHEKVKLEAKNIVAYQGAIAGITSYWESDILTAYNYLLNKVDKKRGIAVFSVGCSSLYAVALAEKMHINAMVMITPKMNYADKERYKNLIDIPTYFINSSHHTETIQTSKELFEWNGSRSSKIQIFKSDNVDYGLLRRNKYLNEDITFWLKTNLAYR